MPTALARPPAARRPWTWTGLDGQRAQLVRFLERRCPNAQEVEDVVQEALLRAARYRSSLVDDGRIEPWLRTIAGNVLADRRRRASRRRECGEQETDLEELCDEGPDPSELVELDEELWIDGEPFSKRRLLRLLAELLPRLEPIDREVLEAYYRADACCRTVAERLGVGPGIVKVRLYRARRRLRRRCLAVLFEREVRV